MGRLTTHVLDTARGCPAEGIAITLWTIDADGVRSAEPVAFSATNSDGRVDAPLLEGDRFVAGTYELAFEAGAYFDTAGLTSGGAGPKFLDTVILRFGIAHADEHYHVPLLLSPYSYSTYRGS